MKLFVIAFALVAVVAGAPDKLPISRQQKQLDNFYGSPSEQVETGYGAPSDVVETQSAYGAPSEIDESLSAYGDDPLDAEASELDESLSDEAADPLAMLMKSVPGIPGEDYPIYSEAPETAFTCEGQVNGGYYADPEAECQAFHICSAGAEGELAKYSFLCPNGTIFNQEYFICDWWFNVDCSEAEALAAEGNAALEAAREEASAKAAEGELDAAASEAVGGYIAAEASAPVASYGVGDADALPSYEDDLSSYSQFRL